MGGFAADGREYVITLDAAQTTPAPWINVIANPHFGFQVAADGGGYTWSVNSRENQLTQWSNDPVTDRPGEVLYLRDEDTGELWGPTLTPVRDASAPYHVRHGQGYSSFQHHSHEIALDLLVFVPLEDPIKISRLRIRNTSTRRRRLSVTAYVEWVLGMSRGASAPFVVTEIDAQTGAMFARNSWNSGFSTRVAFADLAGRQTQWTGDRREFLGRHGSLERPCRAYGQRRDSPDARAPDSIHAVRLQASITAEPGESSEIVFFLGEADSAADAQDSARTLSAGRSRRGARARQVLLGRDARHDSGEDARSVDGHHAQSLDALSDARRAASGHVPLSIRRAAPTDSAINCRTAWRSLLRNHRSPVSICCARLVGSSRKATYSTGGCRRPDKVFAHASPTIASGSRMRRHTTSPSPAMWRFWRKRSRSSKAPNLKPGEHDAYFQPDISDDAATFFEHCARGLDDSLAIGAHGLPLIGTGDWNDGMNRVGEHGRGESVWLGWFLHATLAAFAPVAAARNETARAARWTAHAEALREALERDAWDGSWYRRGYFDDGTPFGSATSDECRIDSIAQSWSVISGAADPARATQAMAAVDEQLIRREDGLALLFTPPFDKTPLDPGYVKGYPPGLRENGGQYTHAAAWSVIAFARLGQGEKAAELFSLLNPINRTSTRTAVRRYKVEPYAVAADVYSVAPHVGRGGWTWYTGSAGWMYRAGHRRYPRFPSAGTVSVADPVYPEGMAAIRDRLPIPIVTLRNFCHQSCAV